MSKDYNPDFNNGYWTTEFVGVQLNFTGNSTGKKVFDWFFTVAGRRDRIPVEVKAFNRDKQVWFEADVPHVAEKVRSTDINELKDEICRRLTEQVTLLTNVEWEDWFEITVTGDNSDFSDSKHSSLGSNLKIQVNRLKRGVDADSGRVLTLVNGVVSDFPQPQSIDAPEEALNGYRFRSQGEKSYIPATAENRAAIDDILLRMHTLRHSIADLLSQDNVEHSLVYDGLKSLPRP